MKIHVISPGVSSARVSGGGTPLFRAIAALLSDHAPVLAYERAGTETAWHHHGVVARQWTDPQRAVDEILDSVLPGDTVLKVSGSLPGRWDMIADIELARVRSRTARMRLIYLDGDGPSRLPILHYTASYLDTTLPTADAVIVCAGGARAVHAYRAMTSAPVIPLTVATVWYGVAAPDQSPDVARFDVAAVFGGDARRQLRVIEICSALASAGLTVALVGSSMENPPAGINNMGFLDGSALAMLVARSRFSLSLVRDDVNGFADIHPCRIVEAVRLRSMIVSDVLPGMARLVAPGREMIALDRDLSILARTLRDFDESNWRTATQRAYERVAVIASEEARILIDTVLDR